MSGKFIVIFKDSATQDQIDKYVEEVNQSGGNVSAKYDSALKGFAASIPDAYLLKLQQQSSLADSPIDLIGE
ncbi:hypothetical protein C8Q75DRAFT_804037 [Abortiporus biennis]|nr:hypothetical protein C8Q75DRAFT_804037 [Abortiporus biennis]